MSEITVIDKARPASEQEASILPLSPTEPSAAEEKTKATLSTALITKPDLSLSTVTNTGTSGDGHDKQSQTSTAASSPFFAMSPVAVELGDPFCRYQLASSPDFIPISGPSTRRESFADSNLGLARVRSEDDSVAESALSGATNTHFRDLDERLRQFVFNNEPSPKAVPADQISTKPLTVAEKLAVPFAFDCAFGWTGDAGEANNIPKDKLTFLHMLDEAKNGCSFILSTLHEYHTEINSRKTHKFAYDFLKKQNDAVLITKQQIDQIEEHIDDVVREVEDISDQDEGQLLKEELLTAYNHLYPWIMRTKRVVYDSHVWYKLNYVMGSHAKAARANATGKNGKQVSKQQVGSAPLVRSLSIKNGVQAISGTPINSPAGPRSVPVASGTRAPPNTAENSA